MNAEKLENYADVWTYPHCEHEEIRCLITQKNNTKVVKAVCKKCGHTGQAIKKASFSTQELDTMYHTSTEKIEKHREDYHNEIDKDHEDYLARMKEQQEEKNAEWWEWYNTYLKSEKWNKKRCLVLERDKYVCQGCLEQSANEVHHLTYKHVGDEFIFELVAICEYCHEKIHEEKNI